MTAEAATLFIFAHQDDEMAAASRIVHLTRDGRPVQCVFLTDGRGGGDPEVRNRESIQVLARLGVGPDNVLFPGSRIPIADGQLVHHLDVALDALELLMEGHHVREVYCLAWEGGHQDHDASHLVAVAFARRRGIEDRTFEMPLYRKAIGPLFRAFSPLQDGGTWEQRRLRWTEGWRLSLLAFRFRSQRKSWLGLFPEAFLKLAILRRETFRRVDPKRLTSRPHEGTLFYEGRFRFPHENFMRAARPFLEKHFR